MLNKGVRFIRIRGRIVPIALGAGAASGVAGFALGRGTADSSPVKRTSSVRPQTTVTRKPKAIKRFRPAASPVERDSNLSGQLILSGLLVGGVGGLLTAAGQERLMKMKVIKPVKNPFRGMRIAEKASLLKKIAKSKNLMEWGKAGRHVGLVAFGLGAIGATINAGWGNNGKRR